MSIIKTKHLSYHYIRHDEEGNVEGEVPAVKDVNLSVEPGEFIAILGHNGSGKSTLAKHFNALLLPSEGCIVVDGMDTADENHTWDVRSTAGMVFQNPDNQIIGTVVEEGRGGGCWLRTGKPRCANKGNLGTSGGKLKSSRNV